MPNSPAEIKAEILRLTREFSAVTTPPTVRATDRGPAAGAFVPGQTTVPYAGRVFTEDEVEAAVSATLDFWLTLGPEGEAFENELAALARRQKPACCATPVPPPTCSPLPR